MLNEITAHTIVELYDGDISGKTSGYISGVRPNHFIDHLGYAIIGEISFINNKLELGQSGDAFISYPCFDEIDIVSIVVPGLTYTLMEGPRIVGKVKVLDIGDSR